MKVGDKVIYKGEICVVMRISRLLTTVILIKYSKGMLHGQYPEGRYLWVDEEDTLPVYRILKRRKT